MNGIAQGLQSTLSAPYLQFFSRLRGNLVDIVSATYKIDGLTDPTVVTPTAVVASTALNLTTTKLGTGRHVIPTGSTAAWPVGYYRATVTFVQATGGPSLTQIIPFEVLTPIDWPLGGREYTGYISTFDLFVGGFVTYSVAAVRLAHRIIDLVSKDINRWTGYEFHPVFGHRYVAGAGTNAIIVLEPVIAAESMSWIWHTADGEDSYTYETTDYWVHNHRLDGEVGVDSRRMSTVEFIIDTTGDPWISEGWAPWQGEDRRLKIVGVFGFTDPEADFGGSQHCIGETPRPIAEACAQLVARRYEDRLLQNPAGHMMGRISEMRTRDQAIKFFGNSDTSSSADIPFLSGDPLIDSVIRRYIRPPAAVFV